LKGRDGRSILWHMLANDYLPLIGMALREDLGDLGDVTSQAVLPDRTARAFLVSKGEGILAGKEVFAAVFKEMDASLEVDFQVEDGALLSRGLRIASVSGRVRSILSAERTAINFIAFLSGIATATRGMVSLAAAYGRVVILDTRKTLPGYRALSKYAVSVGGGRNHRQGLYDMVLIKDNHIDAAGSISEAVRKGRLAWGRKFSIEVECRNAREVEEAVEAGADIVMLDNMGDAEIKDAVNLVRGRAKIEASGNMSEERIGPMSAAGVDYVSMGVLTHSVRSLDFSLVMERGGEP
jgi:nicotinate-nucleotide pyrophosphorylase (carboxylating)